MTKGDNAKCKKDCVVFLYATQSSSPVLHFYQVPKNILKGIQVTERTLNLFRTKQRKITPKVRKPVLPFLYATRLLLFYISTKYHQNIPKGMQVTEWTRSFMLTSTLTPTGSIPKTICPPAPFGRGGHSE